MQMSPHVGCTVSEEGAGVACELPMRRQLREHSMRPSLRR